MTKITQFYIAVVAALLLICGKAQAQYYGGDGNILPVDGISPLSCPAPPHFYAYLGGSGNLIPVEVLNTTSCSSLPAHFFAYMGGDADGAATDELSATLCGIPNQFYAYMGGTGGGFNFDLIGSCPVTPPDASFTASSTTLCVGSTVTFTDTSTNVPSVWSWTFEGGTPATSNQQNPTVQYTTAGTYDVKLVATNYNGADTVILTDYITVTAIPQVLTTTPGSRCDTGTVSLQATSNLGTLRWYDAATGGNLVGTGSPFVTPSLSTNTTYYVEAVSGSCKSNRTAVTATVNTTPSVVTTAPASRCGTGSVTLQASASIGSLTWYSVPSGGSVLGSGASFLTPSISATTTFYVAATSDGCTSARVPVIATVNSTPSVTSTTPGGRCDSGTVTLAATASNGTLNWYGQPSGGSILGSGTTFITPVISTTTTYYVEATDGTCSSPRIAVTATASVSPAVTSTTPAGRCDAGSVTIGAVASAGTLNWYTVALGGTAVGSGSTFVTPNISATTTYYVEAVNGSCVSSRIPVLATVTLTPSVTSTTSATRCGAGSVTIEAEASAGTVRWYNAATGGTLVSSGSPFTTGNLSTSTTYYVEAVNGNCVSPRTAVSVTINNQPTVVSTAGGARCDAGSVNLQATASSGVLRWYNVASGGAVLGTGPFFPTPSISTTTTFYVEAFDGGCISPRTAVVATVNETPTVVSTAPATRCGAGSLTLGASASSGTLSWYNVSTGGTPIGTGASFNTPSISATTTYYVEAANGSCVSTRQAVIAAITTLPTITSTTTASRCDTGSVTLEATASSGTLSWFTTPSGGSAVGTGTSFTTPVISSTTTYYVEATNGSCTSARTAVVATVNATPSIVSTTPDSRCGTGSVSLTAAANTGVLNWYASASGGSVLGTGGTFTTPSISATTTYYVEAANGGCVSVRTAVVATVNTQPDVASVTGASRCDTGSVTLSATATSGILHWYSQASGGVDLGSGVAFITPSLTTTTTFYVEAVNGSCVSARVPVTATITQTPIITSTVPASRCDAGSVTLGATASGGMISWYDAAIGGTELANGLTYTTGTLTTTTTYWVEVANGDCVSMRLPVTATINETPTVVSTTPGSRCDTGSVTLQAAGSGGVLNWYNVATGGTAIGSGALFQTPSIAANTTFYVEAVNGSCVSSRIAVLASVMGTPTVVATTPASRCGSGTVTLGATASAGTLTWYDQAVGGTALGTGTSFVTPVISNSMTFYVQATSGSCGSNRTPVLATVTAFPDVTSTTAATRCGTGTVVLSASASAGTLNWYNVASGGTILASGATFTTPALAVTTTFYVEATNGSCTSSRIAVIATVNNEATITSVTPAGRCGVGSVTLSASGDGTINWFDQPSGGTVLATGTSFTTPDIGATTTYYVEVTNGSCTSIRVPVLATVTVTPEVVETTNADRCGTGTLVLQAVASTGTLNWYNQAIGGLLLGSGSSFMTPAITGTTTFYVEAVNGSCVSARVPVTATVNPLGIVATTTPGSRCGSGSVMLSATGTGTLNWYASATGGSILGTGTSFETPSLSTTTTYFVEATNGSCMSARIPVTATVTIVPTPVGSASQTFCEGETVDMLVVEGDVIAWYDAAQGGAMLTGGTPLVAGTTYYAALSSGGCESDVRLAVTVSVGTCLGTDQPEEAVMALYPNPVVDFLTIASPVDIHTIEVFSMLGQRVAVVQPNGREAKVDMSSMAAATYVLQVLTDEGVKTYKVVKR